MKKYCAAFQTIKIIEVERESTSAVWINGKMRFKNTESESYFDSFQNAKQHLVTIQEKKIDILKYRLDSAKIELDKIIKLEEK